MIVRDIQTLEFNSPIDFSVYNIAELARRIGCSRVHLSNCVKGRDKLSKKLYDKLLKILDIKEDIYIYENLQAEIGKQKDIDYKTKREIEEDKRHLN